ncbi:hypothetical protein [Methylophaga sp. OBS3]|uniref:hypothetical protein n=1 Tax=Methylophaga sp. OBS3 TaxID=2991934 RepID=UPI002251BB5B|nr:hypothetical protein [Methylophaga sp. OBS3]MCX4189013.1 hypothetical protein [Methylophaga sp. OBS3]
MLTELPLPIQCFFNAETVSPDAVAMCFDKNGEVKDEKQTYSGYDAIKKWHYESTKKYSYSVTPISFDNIANHIIVLSKVSGNFDGSPIKLRYFFSLVGNKISSLEICQ